MKKLISILLSVISVICVAFAFGGCGEEEAAGVFYTVTEAYENGYITREDVMSIAYYHNGNTINGNEEIMDENYAPFPKTPETPNAQTKNAIINSFYSSEYWEVYADSGKFTKDDISYSYFGTYNDSVAVKIYVSGEAIALPMWEETVDGIKLYYSNEKQVYIWVKR